MKISHYIYSILIIQSVCILKFWRSVFDADLNKILNELNKLGHSNSENVQRFST
jgi:hypothetical protein